MQAHNADGSHSLVRTRQCNKLFVDTYFGPLICFFGFFGRNLSLGEKPRNTAVAQFVHCDGRDELTNSAVVCTSRGRADSLLPSSAFCLPETVSSHWFSSLSNRFRVKQPPPHTGLRVMYTPGPVSYTEDLLVFARLSWTSGHLRGCLAPAVWE